MNTLIATKRETFSKLKFKNDYNILILKLKNVMNGYKAINSYSNVQIRKCQFTS